MHKDALQIGDGGKRAEGWLKEHLEPHRFSPDRRWLSIAILSGIFLSLYIGFSLPEPTYHQFCAERTIGPAKSFSSPADVFKYALCRADDDISQQSVRYVLHPIFFASRAFFFFIAGILMMHFLRKDREMIMNGALYAIAFFFWSLALVIYVSIYTGWF